MLRIYLGPATEETVPMVASTSNENKTTKSFHCSPSPPIAVDSVPTFFLFRFHLFYFFFLAQADGNVGQPNQEALGVRKERKMCIAGRW